MGHPLSELRASSGTRPAQIPIMLAPNGLACAFTYADEPVERIRLGRLLSAEVLVDEATDQRGKADAEAARLLGELVVLLRLQRDLCLMHGQ